MSSLLVSILGFSVPYVVGGGDSLTVFFSFLVSLCGFSVVVYSKGFFNSCAYSRSRTSLHYLSLSLLLLSLLGVVNSSNGAEFLFAWEAMSITSFFLMLLDADNYKTRRAALNYLVFMHLGFVLLISGFSLISNAGYEFGFEGIAPFTKENNGVLMFVLLLLGFGLKAGMFPLHVWMPSSYDLSPSHVSSIMSGAVSKMGLYGVIRVLTQMQSDMLTVAVILLTVGSLTGLWGVLCCCLQNSLKRALAYSSIENMGIMFLALGASALGVYYSNSMLAVCGMAACLVHAISHSMLKSLLFFSSGNVISELGGERNIDKMGGLMRRMPLSSSLFLVGALSICALPPFSGFVSEFILYFGLLDTMSLGGKVVIYAVVFMFVLAFIGGLALLAFTKIFSVVFLGVERSEVVEDAKEVDVFRLLAMVVPTAGILTVGLLPGLVGGGFFSLAKSLLGVELLSLGALSENLTNITFACTIIIVLSVVFYLWRKFLLRGKPATKTPTWGCGFGAVSEKMQYTGESFTGELHALLPLTKDDDSKAQVSKDEIFAKNHSFTSKHGDRVDTLLSHLWVEIIAKANSKVMKIRTAKVNYQVLYALIFLIAILVLSLVKLI
ncbi:MAG: proton-conducting transporter membrane subunit [Rikenellaceae bacterium]